MRINLESCLYSQLGDRELEHAKPGAPDLAARALVHRVCNRAWNWAGRGHDGHDGAQCSDPECDARARSRPGSAPSALGGHDMGPSFRHGAHPPLDSPLAPSAQYVLLHFYPTFHSRISLHTLAHFCQTHLYSHLTRTLFTIPLVSEFFKYASALLKSTKIISNQLLAFSWHLLYNSALSLPSPNVCNVWKL